MAIVSFPMNDIEKLLPGVSLDELLTTAFNYGNEVEFNQDTIDVEVTPQRPDLYSIEGFARAMKGILGREIGFPNICCETTLNDLYVDNSVREIRPYIGAAMITNINVDENTLKSIIQLQEKLHSTWGRNRLKIAIGIYDLDKITFPIKYTAIDPEGILFEPLGINKLMTPKEILKKHPAGIEYAHLLEGKERYPIIIDNQNKVLSLPPIINSEHSGRVTTQTKNLFIEATGTNEQNVDQTINILSYALNDRGGRVKKLTITNDGIKKISPTLKEQKLELDIDDINQYLGVTLGFDEIIDSLKKMRLDSEKISNNIHVRIPAYRVDFIGKADVIEDIAIGRGYSKFTELRQHILTTGKYSERETYSKLVRREVESLGYTEVMTLVLSNKQIEFENMLKEIDPNHVSMKNSKNSDLNIARISITPKILSVLGYNANRKSPMKIYECDDTVTQNSNSETGTITERKMALATMHSKANFSDIRSVYQRIVSDLGLNVEVKESYEPFFIVGRGADVYLNNYKIGFFGEVHPHVLNNFNISEPVAIMELDVDKICAYKNKQLKQI